MAERILSPSTYLGVLAALVLLTFLTVGVSFIPLPSRWHLCIGLVIGTVKASLVVLIFMHALFSSRVNWMVIGAAMLWTIILFALTFADYVTRGLLPHAPGH
jgi:cytochrome c oxidase subunit IV